MKIIKTFIAVLALTPIPVMAQPSVIKGQWVEVATDGATYSSGYDKGSVVRSGNSISVWVLLNEINGIEVKPTIIQFENLNCSSMRGKVVQVIQSNNGMPVSTWVNKMSTVQPGSAYFALKAASRI